MSAVTNKLADGDGNVVFNIRHKLSKWQQDAAALYNVTYRWPPGSAKAPHGLLAAERSAATEMSMRLALDWSKAHGLAHAVLQDNGANPVHDLYALQNAGASTFFDLHCTMPILMAGDNQRREAAMQLPHFQRHVCGHTSQDCNCVEPDIHLFVHSLYYFKPVEIARILMRTNAKKPCVAFAVVHHFEDAYGNFYLDPNTKRYEATYHTDLSGNFSFAASGNAHSYNHPPISWLQASDRTSSGLHTFMGEPNLLMWDCAWICGTTRIYRLQLADGVVPPPPTIPADLWGPVVRHSDQEILKIVNTHAHQVENVASYTIRTPKVSRIMTDGYHVWYHTVTDEVVTMPRGLVGALAAKALARQRTPELYQTLVSMARTICHHLNIPNFIEARVIILAASTALVCALELETNALGGTWRKAARLIKLYNSVLGGAPLRRPRFWHWVKFAVCNRCFTVDNANHVDAVEWAAARNAGFQLPVNRPLTVRNELFPVRNHKTLDPQLSTSSRLIVDDPRDLQRERRRSRLRPYGICFAEITPNIIERDRESLLQGLKARLLKDNISTNDEVYANWKSLITATERPGTFLYDLSHVEVDYLDREVAYSLWNERFPPSKRNAHDSAKKWIDDGGVVTRAHGRLEVFVKMEKTSWVTLDGAVTADPRIICVPKPKIAVLVGPVIRQYAKAVSSLLTPMKDNLVVWATGCSCEDLGQRHDQYVSEFNDDLVVIVYDIKRYEASQSPGLKEFDDLGIYNSAPRDPQVADCLRALSYIDPPRGSPQNDPAIIFQAPAGRQISGSPNTTSRNTKGNIASLVHFFGEPRLLTGAAWAAMVAGDNGTIYTRGTFWRALGSLDGFHRSFHELGLDVDVKVYTNAWDADFCQLRPYPTADGTVFGPKIGRTLAKFGYVVNDNEADLRSTVPSLIRDSSHVPVLNVFAMQHYSILRSRYTDKDIDSNDKPEIWKTHVRTNHLPCSDTYDMIEHVYGLTRDEVRGFDELLHDVEYSGDAVVISWPRILDLVERDN